MTTTTNHAGFGLCCNGECDAVAVKVLRFLPLGKADAEIDMRRAVPMCADHVAIMEGAEDL